MIFISDTNTDHVFTAKCRLLQCNAVRKDFYSCYIPPLQDPYMKELSLNSSNAAPPLLLHLSSPFLLPVNLFLSSPHPSIWSLRSIQSCVIWSVSGDTVCRGLAWGQAAQWHCRQESRCALSSGLGECGGQPTVNRSAVIWAAGAEGGYWLRRKKTLHESERKHGLTRRSFCLRKFIVSLTQLYQGFFNVTTISHQYYNLKMTFLPWRLMGSSF